MDSAEFKLKSNMYHKPLGLNLDIWLQIMESSPKDVVVGLMGTSKTLNRAGTKYLFNSPLTVTKTAKLLSFMQFFLPPNDSQTVQFRTQFPIGLSIHLQDLSATTCTLLSDALVRFFADVVPSMPRFTHLELYRAEKLLSASPGLGDAIAALTRVEILKVTQAGTICAGMLQTMQSPLAFAYIHLGVEERYMERQPHCLLRNAHATLRVLETHWTDPICRRGQVFPHLKRLSQYACTFLFPEDAMRAFPNLRYLHMDQSSSQQWQEVAYYHESHRNETFLDPNVSYWTSLYKYSGSLNELLLDTTPSHLILRTSWTGASYYLDPEYVAVMSQPGFWRWPMKSLELMIAFRPEDKDVDLEEMMNNILQIVGATDIHAFRLHLDVRRLGEWSPFDRVFEDDPESDSDAENLKEGHNASDDDDPFHEHEIPPVEHALETWDLDAVVERILSTRPSLETAIVTINGHSTLYFVDGQSGPDIAYEEDAAVEDSVAKT
ncbi:hypothetical protein K466DRAFT_596693 [Polyporus arcularius HHB13444]|uniref:F-box domain-containing protein n=1 Tax=Polyporus arcularius HHB13444 TaxID=1314778 RepID=A0A5C3PQY9_9APHY|nr:hypothetical protein K466DRAFT_596693 [Polyporus arcularius HHB13444]